MAIAEQKIKNSSFAMIAAALVLGSYLHLLVPFLTVLFSYLALDSLNRFLGRKRLSILVFLIFLVAACYSLSYLSRLAVQIIPKAADEIIPALAAELAKWGVSLPFADLAGAKAAIFGTSGNSIAGLTHWFSIAARHATLFCIAVTAAVSLFVSCEADLDKGRHRVRHNLYSSLCHELSLRLGRFYGSFRIVMGAQLIISVVNALFTGLLLAFLHVPYPVLLTAVTFVFGLLPTIGGVLSNTVIFGVALSVSPMLALESLLCLIALHRLEYLLNTRIIGARIRNPMFLTLTSLVIGESLMGIPGIILAPVILHYLRVESSEIPVTRALALVPGMDQSKRPAHREA